MSTGYGWEGIRQVCATLLGARHVPERLCGGPGLQRGAITSVRPLPFTFYHQRLTECRSGENLKQFIRHLFRLSALLRRRCVV